MKMAKKRLQEAFAALVAAVILIGAAPSFAKPKKDKKKQPPGPAAKMKIEEVFPTNNYTVVKIRFYDAKGKLTKVKAGAFSWWSNFLKDRRKPAKKRQIDLSKVHYYKLRYTLKLAGYKKLCPPSTAKLRVTFKGTDPKKRFRKMWRKRAKCR